jgi:transcriptional regulator with XRE-family HTH domain
VSDVVFKRVVRWRIKSRRLELGLRQEDVAERANLSLRRFREYEAGGIYFNPTLDTVLKFCKVLETKPGIILGEPSKEEIEQSRKPVTTRVFKKN